MHMVCRLIPWALLLLSTAAEAVVGSCASNFPDGLQSQYSGNAASRGTIDFGYNAQLLGSPDKVLNAKRVNRNSGSTVGTCGPSASADNCTANTTTAAPTQDPGSFPSTAGFTATVALGYQQTSSLAGNGSNQYSSINLGTEAQLTINSGGQAFYIEQLVLSSSSRLNLAPGDYWVGSLTTGFQSQIQVQGSGQVRLFVRDSLTLSSSSLVNSPAINSAGVAGNLYLYAYDRVILNNQATLSGYVYSAFSAGSNDGITLDSPSYVFGALTAENISLNTNARVTYVAPNGSCAVTSKILSWSLDEASWTGAAGEVLDSTSNALNGTVLNSASTANSAPALPQVNAQGTCGYGAFSSTSSQYVQRADNNLLDLQGSFTIGLWVKPRTLPASGLMSILSKDENYEFHLNPSGTINWWWQTTAGSTNQFNSTTALPVGQWSHVLIRYVSGDQRIYINGSLAGQASFSGTPLANGDPLQLGADQGATGRYFNGELDELRIYNGALSEAEISALVAERHQCALNLQCFSDSFDDGSLGDDWAVASRGATSFTPTVSGQRMRLTSNQGNVSTSSTLQRLFPAAGNYIQVQFKYYAYNGSGADGVAVVLSDATVTPQPGAFGGPLGYGTRGDAANPGFAGGWLGVGVDEYGNFSVEGGGNPQQQRPDSVAIRGSSATGGTSGYRYIAGTPANLSPGVDSAASTTAAPGHTYRITMDGRFSNEARVTVERDSGAGFVVLSGLNAVNVLAAVNSQAPLPSDFYLSLTGSTGGSTNIHELDDLQVCATDINPVGQQIDHFEFIYTASALTCNPQPVTIRACLNSSCSSLYTNPVSVTMSPANYWTATAPATVSGSTITFSGGSAVAQLRVPTAGSVALAVQSSVPTTKPNSQAVCSTAGCQISYADSGLLLQVPNLLAAKPTPATISAVRKSDDALQCVPAFANVTRSVSFTSVYANPTSGTQPVVVNASDVRATPVNLNLNFDSTGTAPLTVRYDDAGLMTLYSSYSGSVGTGDANLQLSDDDQFVSKPYGLLLETNTDSSCTADVDCPLYPGGIRAGDAFSLRISAVAWQSDGEALTAAALDDNLVTPNFQLGDITLTSTVAAPSDGVAGGLTPGDYDHLLGSQTTVGTAISEVGVFHLSATPTASYFGETVSGGTSGLVGRFIPAFLGAAGDASLTPSCGSAFSYQGQPMDFATGHEPTLTITGYNRGGDVTMNYDRGDFWRLAAPGVGSYSSVTGTSGLDARLASQGTASLLVEEAGDGDGARSYRWSDEQLLYTPAVLPSSADYPFIARIQQSFVAAALTDPDGACHGNGATCQDFAYDFADEPGSEVRLGRLRIGNAHGSELQSLSLPVILESWQNMAGGSFQLEGLDTCTTATALAAPLLDQYSGSLAAGETTPSLSWPLDPAAHALLLSAPGSGNDGSVQVSFPSAPSWLQYPWDGATRSAARGLATFGIYKGAAPLIFRRELYRQ
ncbi:hypothetical protein LRS11_07600 [Pseudomonas sp. J452]|uniref:DUF6701 domain-containing protein n=1 Tax=Pseudomonas sp. J452 TaxID=2898441 RepID=UPI0021AD8D4C|nr:DUF6701 domain-containing protein [Pseudomonas sp. J452]UUY09887.1 hypothetical protein LRS11_07600 [Pseudomonas sp. J452]